MEADFGSYAQSNSCARNRISVSRGIAFTEAGIELAEFKELKNPLIVQKTVLEQQLAKVEKGEASPIEPLKNFILEANQAQKWLFSNNWLEMKSFLQNIGLNREIRSQTLTVSFKNPFIYWLKPTLPLVTRQTFLNNVRDGGGGGN